MAWKITADVVPEKAGRPVSISYSTAPEEIACLQHIREPRR
jgi:hypothetical protein